MLDPSADEIRDWGNSVIQLMADYLGNLRDRKVYCHMSSREIRDRLDPTVPTKGIDLNGLLKVFRETVIPFSRQNAHPRMFGYVQSPGTPLAALGDLLALDVKCESDGLAFRAGAGGTRAPNDQLDPANSWIQC